MIAEMEIYSRSLKIFCAVADTGSLQVAAGRIALSPSAISRVIAGLEADLGIVLFDRSERRMELTQAGREFLLRTREAVLLLDELANFGRRSIHAQAPLRIAAFSRHAEPVVAPAMAHLLQKDTAFGSIKLDVHAQRDFGFSRLARPFDIGFGHMASASDEFVIVPLAMSPVVAVLPPGHRLADHDALSPADLRGHPLITLSGDTIIGRIVREAVRPYELNAIVDVSHTYVALRLVREGLGLHVTDQLAVLQAKDTGCRCIPLKPVKDTITLSAFWPKRAGGPDKRVEATVSAVRDFIERARS
jgi:DNA-binding transcriptional LysR family regulator